MARLGCASNWLQAGIAVSRKCVARLMRAAGLAGVSRRRWPGTTRRDVEARPAPDLVNRRFEADAPNRLWVADIIYVPALAGFLYLAFGARCRQWGVAPSMGSVGDCYGNAMAESFFAPLAFERRQQADPVDGARPVDARRAPTSPLDPALRARAPHRPQGTMYMA